MISGQVCGITCFLNEHPGAKEVLLEQAGASASGSFEDVGHTSDARELLEQYEVANVYPNDLKPENGCTDPWKNSCWSCWIFPIIGIIL